MERTIQSAIYKISMEQEEVYLNPEEISYRRSPIRMGGMSEFHVQCDCCGNDVSDNLTKLFNHRRTYNSSISGSNCSKNNNFRKLCFYCPLHFDFTTFIDGYSSLQKEKPGPSCDFCRNNFLTEKAFHHECDLCNISSIKTCGQLFNHLKNVHKSEKPFRCLVCSSTYTYESNLKKHILSHISSTYKCGLCPQTFSEEKHLKDHKCKILKIMPLPMNKIHTVNNEEHFPCELCDKKLKTRDTLKMHVLAMHGNVRYYCPTCPKIYSTKSSLKAHYIKNHTSLGKKFKCDQCPKEYVLAIDLNHHKRKKHDPEPMLKRFNCDICPKAFERKSDLWNHKSIYHTSRIKFKCDQCPKTYFRKYDLKFHKNVHSGERPYSCDLCGKTFIKPDHVKRHRYSHSEEKRFECNICKKKFFSPDAVSGHKKSVHSEGERKSYPCDLCDKIYFKRCSLANHRKVVHTREQLNECNLCHRKFLHPNSLKYHLDQHEKEK